MKKNRLSLKLIARSLKEIHYIRKGYMAISLLDAAWEAFHTYPSIWMSAILLDAVARGEDIKTLLTYAIITAGVDFITRGIREVFRYLQRTADREFDEQYAIRFSQFNLDTDYSYIENPATHELRRKVNRFKNYSNQGILYTFNSFRNIMYGIVNLILATASIIPFFLVSTSGAETAGIIAFAASPLASAIIVVIVIMRAVFQLFMTAYGEKYWTKFNKEIESFDKIYSHYIKRISDPKMGMDIRIYGQRKIIEEEIEGVFVDWTKAKKRIQNKNTLLDSIWYISHLLLSVCSYIFMGLRVLAGLFGVGSLLKYVKLISNFNNSVSEVTWGIASLATNTEALELYFEYIDHPSEMHKGVLPVEKRILCDGGDKDYEVEFKNVSFKYPGCDNYVLKNVSLKFKIGEKLAVVGMNGSGKTTFIKLLCRLYDPSEGEILLNGINIKKYDYDEYMSIFSVVFQDFKLFSFTLGQNVATSSEYDPERVKECLEQAGMGERFEQLENGAETFLYRDFEEEGIQISGGEAQKIALARALYRNAPFVILDEPTAALDPVAVFDIYSRFNSIVGDRTTIYISHRLSSCRFCDSIMVFHEGSVIQRGTHDELMENTDGKYYELWTSQAQHYS